MDDEADAQPGSDLRRPGFGWHVQHRGCRQDIHALQISQARDQRIREPQAKSIVVVGFAHKQQRQHGKRGTLVPLACVLLLRGARRSLSETVPRILSVDDSYGTDEPVAFADYSLNEAWFGRVVTESRADLAHNVVEIPVDIDKQIRTPEFFYDVFA